MLLIYNFMYMSVVCAVMDVREKKSVEFLYMIGNLAASHYR